MRDLNKKIIGLLETRQTYHSTQSITRWKQAINAFESIEHPSRVLMYDMYDDIMLDGHLSCVWDKRVNSILNRRMVFLKDGKEDEEITKLLNSTDMRNITKELMNSIAYGYTLIQVNGITYDDEQECYKIDFDVIPRKHVHPEREFECISKEQSSITADFLFKQPPLSKYIIDAGEPKDKGILIKAAAYVIYKRGGFGDWAQFSEMFGMPLREAIYDGYDEDSRARVKSFLEEWSSNSYFLHQKDVELKIHDTGNSTSSVDVYDKLIAVCDAGISKVILGNTLTTEQGENGARSLGEVHEDEQKSISQSDGLFILSVLNTKFRAIMKRFGINATGGSIWFESPDTDWNKIQTKWNVINSVSQRIPVDDDYIYEEIGIPKPDNYDQLKKEQEERRQAMQQALQKQKKTDDDEENTPPAPTDKKKLSARIADFFGVAPQSI